MKRFVSDLQQRWNEKPFAWDEEGSTFGAMAHVPRKARVTILGPHPDDPESVAITSRLLLQNGCDLRYVIVSMSPSGVEDSYARARQGATNMSLREKKSAIRRTEQLASARMLGLSSDRVTFLCMEEKDERRPLDSPENSAKITSCLADLAPDIVVMPVGRDRNPTHAWTHRVFRVCAPVLAKRQRRTIVGFYNEDPKTTDIRADLLVLFGEQGAKWKGELLRLHDSQHQRNVRTRGTGFDERILEVNRSACRRFAEPFGLNSSTAGYAEVFEVELFDCP